MMGQYANHINYFGIVFTSGEENDGEETPFDLAYDALRVELDKHPVFKLELIGAEDGANLSVDDAAWLICFRRLTKENAGKYEFEMNGDTNGVPTATEIQQLKDLCARHGLPYSDPVRDSNTYIS